jgi:hypothetical protein
MAEQVMPTFQQKSPPELVERFEAVLDRYPDVTRKKMFGYPAAFVGDNGDGLFADRWMSGCPMARSRRRGPSAGRSSRCPASR